MRPTLYKPLIAIACCLVFTITSIAQNFHIVKDVNTATNSNPSNAYGPTPYTPKFAILNGVSYFSASDGLHGTELWRSDGTKAGTYMVKDINSGFKSSNAFSICILKSKLYFVADDGIHGLELWRSDGTATGTSIVKDINPGPGDGFPYQLMENGEYLFFAVSNGGPVCQFWRSDGTDAGTIMLKDFTQPAQTIIFYPSKVGQYVCFLVTSYPQNQLWKTTGTVEGTTKVKDINYGGFPHAGASNGKTMYFDDGNVNLWKSDGTTEGTAIASPVSGTMSDFVFYKDTLVFTVNGSILYKSDGSFSGTYSFFSKSALLGNKTVVGDKIFFTADKDGGNHELWKTNMTRQGTTLVKLLDSGFIPGSSSLTAINNKLYFAGYTQLNGKEFWKSDGTDNGTFMFMDILPGTESSNPGFFTALKNSVLFNADNGVRGSELWTSDTLTGNISLLKDINTAYTADAIISNPTVFKGKLYFAATNKSFGNELWRTDGTAPGTAMVKDINKGGFDGVYNSNPFFPFLQAGNNLYFLSSTQYEYGSELWKTNGNAASTSMVADLSSGNPGTNSYFTYPSFFHMAATVNGRAYFVASPANSSSGLYSVNSAGTSINLIKETFADNLTALGKKLFYVTDRQLWITDSTAQTNKQITTAQPDGRASLFSYKQFLYFGGADGYMWRTDGINATRFKNIRPDPYYFSLYQDVDYYRNDFYTNANAVLNNILYFAAYDSIHGSELWKTNGTPAGTVLMKDINSGKGDAQLGSFVVINNVLYFLANDGINGRELWKTDGTEQGTVMIKNITTGSASSEILSLTQVGTKVAFLLFNSNDKVFKLWQSDGTTAGTKEVADTALANAQVFPPLRVIGENLFFTASNTSYGSELWVGSLGSTGLLFTDGGSSSITKSNTAFDVAAYPNPVSSDLQIRISNHTIRQAHIQIFNAAGNLILKDSRSIEKGTSTLSFDASTWAAGLYVISVKTADGTAKEIKVVKQ